MLTKTDGMTIVSSDGWSLTKGGLWFLIYSEADRHILIPVDFTCKPMDIFAGDLAWESPHSANPIPALRQSEIRGHIAEALHLLNIAANLDERPQTREGLIISFKIRQQYAKTPHDA
jgi:hypothetical protein